jgi:hypothetical protein
MCQGSAQTHSLESPPTGKWSCLCPLLPRGLSQDKPVLRVWELGTEQSLQQEPEQRAELSVCGEDRPTDFLSSQTCTEVTVTTTSWPSCVYNAKWYLLLSGVGPFLPFHISTSMLTMLSGMWFASHRPKPIYELWATSNPCLCHSTGQSHWSPALQWLRAHGELFQIYIHHHKSTLMEEKKAFSLSIMSNKKDNLIMRK